MGRYTGNKAEAPRKKGNPLWAGLFIGMVVGAGLAAGLAWFLMKTPGPFLQKTPTDKAVVDTAKALPPAETTAMPTTPAPSGANNGKPRFEFYNVLTGKQDTKTAAPAKSADKAKPPEKSRSVEKASPTDSKPAPAYEPQILQVGSFSSADDAEKLKAKLALIGTEAHIVTANVPDKGVRYRVRLGPYRSAEEMNRARGFLKQNGMDSTPMRAQ
ncbi:MAG: SPOR domain-containing protein [Nitrosomonadales bacterium]|nr:SPOR domain-containing protein [Nitrosomonadales bacterium]